MPDIFPGLALLLLITAIFALVRLHAVGRRLEALEDQFRKLEHEVRGTKVPASAGLPGLFKEARRAEPLAAAEVKVTPEPRVAPQTEWATPVEVPSPVPQPMTASSNEVHIPPKIETDIPPAPPLIEPEQEVAPVSSPQVVDWEKFLGVKLFAWVGGLALFLGISFFVKYSFEHNLIPPWMRIALGFLAGFGLVAGGLLMRRKEYAVTSQSLCATGIVALYGVSFAAHALYHLLGTVPVFAVMILITVMAFGLAVKLDARVIAILGEVGGFLTPPLLSTGVDNAPGLFGYVALLDVGLLAIALRQRWHFLFLLAAIGTGLTEFSWLGYFFSAEKLGTATVILAVFNGLAAAGFWMASRLGPENKFSLSWVLIQAGVCFLAICYFLKLPELDQRPGMVLLNILIADLALLSIAQVSKELFRFHIVAGIVAFVLLTMWINTHFSEKRLYWALGAVLLFATLHSVYPVLLQRKRAIKARAIWANLFPLVALGLMLITIFHLEVISMAIWPVVFLLDLLIMGLAFVTSSLLIVAGAVLMTGALTAAWIFRAPANYSGNELVMMVGFFALVFVGGGFWLLEKGAGLLAGEIPEQDQEYSRYLPGFSALLPFLLLAMMLGRFPEPRPNAIFGLVVGLDVILLWLANRLRAEGLDLVALAATLLLEMIWTQNPALSIAAGFALRWELVFYLLFFIYPYILRRDTNARIMPWAVSALSGPAHFYFIYEAARKLWPGFGGMGLVPAAMAVPAVAALAHLWQRKDLGVEQRVRMLAWAGASALFFITLIFPIQFSRQWLTIGWALEGAALTWLYRRAPQRWLVILGVMLLVVAFARLALNLSVFSYYPRSGMRIWNWYLYSYGIVAACQFAGARFLSGPRKLVFGMDARPLLSILGTVLCFILLNIEIADFFAEGNRLRFEFSGRFDRDMTYSIAWALFALGLLLIGIRRELRPVRYASLGLLGLTLAKLFLHDLNRLGQLYRVGAFMGVAVILIFSSWVYQRYLASPERGKSQ
jgi:uncharacterized membrane protein